MDNQKKEKQDPGINPRKYKDLEGGSWKRANIGLWFLKHRRGMFIGGIIFLIALSLILYSYFFYNIYDYIRYSPEERKALEELSLIDRNLSPTRLAIPLEEGKPQSFFHNDKYDFVNQVKNPNSNFLARITYCFFSGEEKLICDNSVLFPEEEKYLIALSLELDNRPSNLDFKITDLGWQRIDTRVYSDWEAYYSERMDFTISDLEFESSRSTELDLGGTNNLSFNIKNNTPYNYWELPLSIILFDQRGVVGVNRYNVLEFMSLEDRDINLFWTNSINSVNQTEVQIDLDILNEDNYIRYR